MPLATNSKKERDVVLLDLGNVVLGIDPRQVFSEWSARSGLPVADFARKWVLDDAYKEHERGKLNFENYCRTLNERYELSMSYQDWEIGWNKLWTKPFAKVIDLFPDLKANYRLCAFSNTNATHAKDFKNKYPEVLSQFDELFLSHEIGERKPDAAGFELICKQLNCQPSQIAFFDDTQENIDGAKKFGIRASLTRGEMEVASALKSLLLS